MNDIAFNRQPVEGAPRQPSLRGVASDAAPAHGRSILVRYLQIISRWRWFVMGAVVLALFAGLLITLLITPLYTAEATLEIQRENNRVVAIKGAEPEGASVDLEFYQTQYGLLESRALAERVATNLRLYENPQFFETFGDSGTVALLRETGRTNNAEARRNLIRRAGEILLNNVDVSPIRLSRLVDVRFTSPDPQLSARILNAWNQHFVQSALERRFEATSYARRFLEQRLEELRRRLEESERRLVAYAASQRIINIPSGESSAPGATGGTTERSLVATDLEALNRELNAAIAARVAAESRLRGGAGGATPEALQNQAISTLRQRRAELAAEHARILTQFEADYPPAQAIASQIRELDRSIGREEGRVSTTIQGAYQAAVARETALRGRVQGLQGDLLNLRGRTIQYNIYQRDVDTNRQLYDGLLQRYKEIGVAGGVGVNNIAVVDAADVPMRPSSPNLPRNLLLSLLIGGVVGVGLAFALDQISETISEGADVERMLGLPLLGTIPLVKGRNPEEELVDPKSPLVEAYLSAQTSLSFSTDHGIPRSFAITSTQPAEGKSLTTYALSQSLARTGRRIVLVDADMRAPSMHHVLGVGNAKGLSNYLTGDDNLSALIQRDLTSGISLLPAGPPPPNAAELLTGNRFDRLIAELGEQFDHVVVDSPPVLGLADTPLIASRTEGVVFIIASHAARSGMIKAAVDRLRNAQAHVLGALLTKFESRRAPFGYGYDYGYGYGYGRDRDGAETNDQ